MTDPIQLPAVWVPLIAVLIPLLSSLTVKAGGRDGMRAAVAIAAAVLLAIAQQLVDDQADTVETLVAAAGTALVAAIVAYHALWKHLATNDRVVPRFGLTGDEVERVTGRRT